MQNFKTLRQPLRGELAMSPEEEEEEKKMPFIVATYVNASSQGQRTYSARTNLRLDYILTARSTTQTICCCCAAQLAGRDLCVQLYSHRPLQALCTKIDKTNVPLYYDRLDKCSTVL